MCWIHAERLVHKAMPSDERRQAKEGIQSRISLYADLKTHRTKPTAKRKAELTKHFEEIFSTRTCYATLNKLLGGLKAQKSELLAVLERPDIPLHTNGSENDIRCQVTRRVISGGTRSDIGRDCRGLSRADEDLRQGKASVSGSTWVRALPSPAPTTCRLG